MSALYASARGLFATGGLVWGTAAVSVVLVSSLYEPNTETDTAFSAVPNAAVLAGPLALGGMSVVDGWCKAANAEFPAMTLVTPAAAVLLVQATGGAQATWPLIACLTDPLGAGIMPNNAPLWIIWSAQGIFRV